MNDVPMSAEALRRVIATVPDYRLAWVAQNGAEAVELCEQDTPDLILMDLIMPVMDGAEATRRIMANTPCAILVVTATVDGHSAQVFEALAAGALDAVETPVLRASGQPKGAAALKYKINVLGGPITGEVAKRDSLKPIQDRAVPGPLPNNDLVVIGASAGGPAALATILTALPSDFGAATMIVQHIDVQFAPLMAQWLSERCALPVRIAQSGDRPQSRTVLVAATNDHLVLLKSGLLEYTKEPNDCSYRPSVDVFFDSVVRHWRGKAVGVLLSGMGRDGAKGLKAMRDARSFTIAQDRESSVVYGMPKAAAEMGAAVEILPVDKIANRLIQVFPNRSLSTKA